MDMLGMFIPNNLGLNIDVVIRLQVCNIIALVGPHLCKIFLVYFLVLELLLFSQALCNRTLV